MGVTAPREDWLLPKTKAPEEQRACQGRYADVHPTEFCRPVFGVQASPAEQVSRQPWGSEVATHRWAGRRPVAPPQHSPGPGGPRSLLSRAAGCGPDQSYTGPLGARLQSGLCSKKSFLERASPTLSFSDEPLSVGPAHWARVVGFGEISYDLEGGDMPALPTAVGDLESPLSIPAPVPHPLTQLCALAWHSRGLPVS